MALGKVFEKKDYGLLLKLRKKFEIPYGYTVIGEWAFSECKKLTTITIPNSVTEIGQSEILLQMYNDGYFSCYRIVKVAPYKRSVFDGN